VLVMGSDDPCGWSVACGCDMDSKLAPIPAERRLANVVHKDVTSDYRGGGGGGVTVDGDVSSTVYSDCICASAVWILSLTSQRVA
jgi:hypothetical protein